MLILALVLCVYSGVLSSLTEHYSQASGPFIRALMRVIILMQQCCYLRRLNEVAAGKALKANKKTESMLMLARAPCVYSGVLSSPTKHYSQASGPFVRPLMNVNILM